MPFLETTQLESYLSDEEFEKVMGVDRETFKGWPKWKQIAKKKDLDHL